MAVGKRIYLKRHMPDKEVMMQFKNIPASNTCDVMGRNAAMNPRIRLVSQPKEQMAVGPALTVKARGGDNLALHAALNIAQEGDFIVVSNEEDDTRSLMGEIMMAESDGLECVSVSARVADAGNLSHVKLVVRGEQNQAGAEIASVRRKIGAYYGVEERDIEVDVEGE